MNPLNLILASASPRRQKFLRELGLAYSVVTADLDETPLPDEAPEALVARLARAKATYVAGGLSGSDRPALIVAADTIVALDREILGKPADQAEAVAMLRRLRQQPHFVHSAVSLRLVPVSGASRQATRVNTTRVTMRAYTDAEIAAYVASGDPLDKAGAYAIQHRAFAPVQSLCGCPAAVMGLPVGDLREMLLDFGVTVPMPVESTCSRLTGLACCQTTSLD